MELRTYRLGELCQRLSSGKAITAADIKEEGKYLVYGANGSRGYTDSYNFDGACAVIGRQGAYCGNVKYVEGQVYMSEHAVVAQANIHNDSKYLAYKLGILQLGRFSGQAAQPGLSVQRLSRLLIEIPSKEIQQKIAHILSRYDEAIENNNKRIKLLEQMAQNLYKEWFVRFRFPGWETCEFENGIPKAWNYVKFEDILSFERGISYSSEEIECDDGLNLINLKNIDSFGGFRRDGKKKYNGKYKENQVVIKGDLVVGVTDMTQDRRTVGAVALIPTLQGLSVISADLVKVISDISNVYLYSLCRYGFYSKYFSQFANGANVLHLKPSALLNKKVLLPSKELIDSYVKKASVMIDLIDELNLANENLAKQRDLLLPRLMSGKIEVE